MSAPSHTLSALPAVDRVLRTVEAQQGIDRYGRPMVVAAIRATLDVLRAEPPDDSARLAPEAIAAAAAHRMALEAVPSQRPVFNLTGTVLHTNLGRALLAEAAREAALGAMRDATNLEFDLEEGARGDRDDHVRELICRITGAADAAFVNNNAAAVLLTLNTLALGREAVVSRGELVEIGGSFRMPEIMARAGARLREVGTTNRTHLRDYEEAIGPETALLMKVHTSNFLVQGFIASVPARRLAAVAKTAAIPLIDDLGSGVLVDLAEYGLAGERTVQAALKDGADLVLFSADKLLGGPQAGIIVGRPDLIGRLKKNPLRRALRLDKVRLAALEATLRLYLDPAKLAESLPTLRLLVRSRDEIAAVAEALQGPLADALGETWSVRVTPCESEAGSGALPLATIPSMGLAIEPPGGEGGRALERLAAAFRRLPRPVIGRVSKNAYILDLRCLEDVSGFTAQLADLKVAP